MCDWAAVHTALHLTLARDEMRSVAGENIGAEGLHRIGSSGIGLA